MRQNGLFHSNNGYTNVTQSYVRRTCLSCFTMTPADFNAWFEKLHLLLYIPSYVVIRMQVIELFPQIINRNKCSSTHEIHVTHINNHINQKYMTGSYNILYKANEPDRKMLPTFQVQVLKWAGESG